MRVGSLGTVVVLAAACRKAPPPPAEHPEPRAPLDGPFESLDMAFDADMPRREILTAAASGPFDAVALLRLDEADPFCVVTVQYDGHWYHGAPIDCAHRDASSYSDVEGLAVEHDDRQVVLRFRVDRVRGDANEEHTEYALSCGLERGAPACSAPAAP